MLVTAKWHSFCCPHVFPSSFWLLRNDLWLPLSPTRPGVIKWPLGRWEPVTAPWKFPKGGQPKATKRPQRRRKERCLEFTESPSHEAGNERRGRHADDLKYGRIDTHSSSHIYYAYMLTKIHIYIHANMWINGMKIFRGLIVSSLFFPFFW